MIKQNLPSYSPVQGKALTVKGLLEKNNQLLEDQKAEFSRQRLANWIMIIATIALALTAGYDAFTNKEGVSSHRPYISMQNQLITKKEEGRYNFVAELENIGGRATAPGASVGVYPIRLENNTYIKNPPNAVLIPNELIPSSGVITYNFDFPVKGKPQFFIVKIKYEDAIIGSTYSQIFFFNWDVNKSLTLVKEEKVWKELRSYFQKND